MVQFAVDIPHHGLRSKRCCVDEISQKNQGYLCSINNQGVDGWVGDRTHAQEHNPSCETGDPGHGRTAPHPAPARDGPSNASNSRPERKETRIPQSTQIPANVSGFTPAAMTMNFC